MDENTFHTILNFLGEIGIKVVLSPLNEPTFLPGLKIQDGGLIIDTDKLSYPGDILHEAGHIAVTGIDTRPLLNEELIKNDHSSGGKEMAAIAWSYAACKYLNIDPVHVFHADGYKGAADNILENFNAGRYFGVPLLAYYGMTNDATTHKTPDNQYITYPGMKHWLSQID
ncbi:hypothetical protein MUY27_16635 [Mucilaginibacter sp. RS28]|uniref:Uncharacterized protein n=1 Tax=Mucilaginibacter straminoryzae TaxID=2932774 RepID=A0A9X1X5A5_9SPHI|nr:hypothetical protein [Mucilaginibacter straminoryzae]MCJ8211347.1 hypothetical protein [Mucilaginibacter straminoryzae]